MQDYIFGYGSLIERESRLRTNPDARNAWPAIVQGYSRGWYARNADPIGFTTTYLGVQQGTGKVNGVIYAVTEADLAAADARESGYHRAAVDRGRITMLCDEPVPGDGRFWIYVSDADSVCPPNAQVPIVQSYVDICLNGCLEVEAEYAQAKQHGFAAMFLDTTTDWSAHWVNDRLYPRRPFIFLPNASTIDGLLHEHRPDEFARIRIE